MYLLTSSSLRWVHEQTGMRQALGNHLCVTSIRLDPLALRTEHGRRCHDYALNSRSLRLVIQGEPQAARLIAAFDIQLSVRLFLQLADYVQHVPDRDRDLPLSKCVILRYEIRLQAVDRERCAVDIHANLGYSFHYDLQLYAVTPLGAYSALQTVFARCSLAVNPRLCNSEVASYYLRRLRWFEAGSRRFLA